jgi:hypothetical protein
MRIAIAALAAVLITTPATATEVSLKLDDGAQNAVSQLPTLLDQCVSGVTVHGDATVCRTVSNFLAALGNEVKSAQAAAAKAAADKAAADEAAKKAAAPPSPIPAPTATPN